MNTEKLEKNITDQIREAQLKLGFVRETVRLYYPLDSLNAILESDIRDADSMLQELRKNFSDLRFCCHEGRIEISVPPEQVELIHREADTPAFLVDMIELFQNNHHCELADICMVFEKYSRDYICEKMPEEADFDYVLYFKDPEIDEYYYCVKMEMGHTIYHRFMKADYLQLIR